MRERRLDGLPAVELPGDLRVLVATTYRSRLLGLALLEELPYDHALLIPRCRSVHTFGMRFALDLAFLTPAGDLIRLATGVPPRRLTGCRSAHSVLEMRAGAGARFLAAGAAGVARLR